MIEKRITTKRRMDLITSVSERSGVKPKKVKRVLDALISDLIDSLKRDGQINIDGLGVFSVSKIGASKIKNTHQSDYTDIPAFNRIYFSADKSLKSKLNEKTTPTN